MNPRNIAITTSNFDMTNPLLDELRSKEWNIVRSSFGRRLSEDEVVQLLSDTRAIGMVAGVEPLTERVFESNPQLRVVSRCGTGYDSIDLAAAERHGVRLRNTPDAPASAVAELTVGLILSALRSIPQADRGIRSGEWQAQMGSLLAQRVVGVVGFGRIGSRVADLCSAFGARVTYHDPLVATARYRRHSSIADLADSVDVLTVHVPLNRANRLLIDADVINRLPDHAILVNTSRGGIVDEAAVLAALEAGSLAGAAFDVLLEEPYAGPLRDLENVVLTPHMGSYAREARSLMESEALRNLQEALARLGL